MKITGTPEEIMDQAERIVPGAIKATARARKMVPAGNQDIYPYQAAVLYALANQFDQEDNRILEIGTYYGYSTAVLAQAVPNATIISLNPTEWEVEAARKNLQLFDNVVIHQVRSWEYLTMIGQDEAYCLVFVDGDHKRVKKDLTWWNRVADGGLFLFHDYAPLGTRRHCPPVYEAVNEFSRWLGLDGPDVLIIDSGKVGMAGFYRHADSPDWNNGE